MSLKSTKLFQCQILIFSPLGPQFSKKKAGGECFAPYKLACKVSSKSDNRIRSTSSKQVANPHIFTGDDCGPEHQRRYVQLAVNRQPGYRQGNS